jgi:hypothetical protein
MVDSEMIAELARALPDQPRWVQARGMLLSGRCDVLLGPEGGRGAGYLVVDSDGKSACAVHRPVSSLVAQLESRANLPGQLLAPLEHVEPLAAMLPTWRVMPATIHVHPAPESLPVPAHEARFLTGGDVERLRDLPPALEDELALALGRGPVAGAFAEGRAVAFAYCAYETERWIDVSIDTLPSHRRQGYATSAAALLIHTMLARGKKPVWGALDADTASLAMAAKYGFRAIDRLAVLVAPAAKQPS